MNLEEYPLVLLKNVKETFERIRVKVNNRSDLVRINYDDNLKLSIVSLDFNSKFSFTIHTPKYQSHRISYVLNYTPKNSSEPINYTVTHAVSKDSLIVQFNFWLANVEEYQNMLIHPSNEILKSYKEQFKESFMFLDEEKDNVPLEPIKQLQLSEFLNSLVKELENDQEVDEKIIEEIKYLNTNISKLTQKQIKDRLSWYFAKMMYLGVGVINNITKVGKDAGIGYLLIEGVKKYLGS